MLRELADSETPFTDIRVEDNERLQQASFNRLLPEQSSLLPYILNSDKAYGGALYNET
jgi:hypothetical protein